MKQQRQRGNSILEFAIVMTFLVPLFAGAFSIGMALVRSIEVSNVSRDAAVLMVRAATDPNSGLDLAQSQNQQIIVRAASGLGMNTGTTFVPNPSGLAVVILSKVVMVGPNTCAAGITPTPPSAPPWSASNCPNYNSYVFAYRVVIGNSTRWQSTLGTPPAAIVNPNGMISAASLASNTGNIASNFGSGGVLTLTPDSFALVSEMYADVSALNIFSIMHTPILYARTVT
jgi:Flp pilus assembly protein TadG